MINIDLELRNNTINNLNEDTKDGLTDSMERIEVFRATLDKLYKIQAKGKIKSIGLGVVMFKRNCQLNKILSKNKKEKDTSKFKIEMAQVHLDMVNQYILSM